MQFQNKIQLLKANVTEPACSYGWRSFFGLVPENCKLTDGEDLEYLKIFPYGLLFAAFVGMFLNLLWISLDQKYAPTLSFILDGFEEGMASVFRALIQIRRDREKVDQEELEASNRPNDNGYVETRVEERGNSILMRNQNSASWKEHRMAEKEKLREDMEQIWKKNGTKKYFREIERICRKRSKEYGMIQSIR